MLTEVSFYVTGILFGISLAMDAFSVSLANGMNEPCMKLGKACGIAGMFAFFQALMPFLGWVLMTTLLSLFESLTVIIPWVALVLLGFIGGKMLLEGIRENRCGEAEAETADLPRMGIAALLVQGVATSIDALSVGFDIVDYDWLMALCSALIIAAVTFVICLIGVAVGRKFGTCLAGKASIFGGVILIAIGLEIFISGLLGA